MISNELALALWYRAAGAKLGLLVPTNDINYLMQVLYTARRESEDTELDRLSLVKVKIGVAIMDRERCENVVRQAQEGNGKLV